MVRPNLTLAERFESVIEGFPVGGYRAEMSAAEGSSGDQGPQQIRLVPPDKQGRRHLIGHVNPAAGEAQLLTLEALNQGSMKSFKESTGLDPTEYAAFLVGAARCLEGQGLTVVQVQAAAAPPAALQGGGMSPLLMAGIGIGAVVIFFMGIAVGVLLTRLDVVH
jgi:hypothetical protein